MCKSSARGHTLHLELSLVRVRDKQFVNEASVVFPECRAATLHSDTVCPIVIKTLSAFIIEESSGLATMFTGTIALQVVDFSVVFE